MNMSILQIGQCLMSSSFLQDREEDRGSVLIIYAPSVKWWTPLASTHLYIHWHKIEMDLTQDEIRQQLYSSAIVCGGIV